MKQLATTIPSFPRPYTGLTMDDIRQRYGVDKVYPLDANETPLGPSPQVITAVQQAATELGLYPPMGDETLRQAIVETLGRGLTMDNIFTGCSGYEALELITRAYLEPGDEVIVHPPTFGVFAKITRLERAKVVAVALERPSFSLDVEAVLAAITPRTRLIILCNPNNPTGIITTAAQMQYLMAHLPDHVILITDEVYHDFVTRADYPDSLAYVLDGRNIVVIHSFAKAYGLPGLRLGYGIAPPPIADHVGGLHRGFHQNRLALAAGIAALGDPAHMQRVVAVTLAGKQWLYEQLEALSVRYWRSETNFVLMETAVAGSDAVEHLRHFGVLVKAFPGELDNCIRVTVGLPEANERFIEGLAALVQKGGA
jgi:histidinol-phosphate aminotransferase